MRRVRAVAARHGVLVAGAALFVVFGLLSDRFATGSNLENIAIQASATTILAVGMTFVIMTAGIDLSIGAIAFLSVAVATEALDAGVAPGVAMVAMPVVGLLLGAVNGVVVARVGINALIVTLATLSLYRGVAGRLTELQNIGLPDGIRTLGTADALGVPAPVIATAIAVLAGHLLLRRTVFGRYVQAIGSNRHAAEEAGLPVRRVLAGVYALMGVVVGVAALIIVGRLGTVQPTIGSGLELTVITAVVLGGTSLFGGRGSVLASVLGAVILTVVENGLIMVGASPFIFDIVRAAVLILAVVAEALQRREVRAGLLRRQRVQEVAHA